MFAFEHFDLADHFAHNNNAVRTTDHFSWCCNAPYATVVLQQHMLSF